MERKNPSPIPAMHRPIISIVNVKDAHSIMEPMPKIKPPRANVRVRDILSDKGPATRDAIDAVMSIEEAMKPCISGEIGWKAPLN